MNTDTSRIAKDIWNGPRLITSSLDGKMIAYSSETEFLVQVGKKTKGAYKTSYRFVGDLPRAVFFFNSINIGLGFKKRLLMPSCTKKPVLARSAASL